MRETVDIAIIDLFLGRHWGIDLIPTLRAHAPHLRVTITSAALRPDHVIHALAGGANDVIEKPFDLTTAIARLRHGAPDARFPAPPITLAEHEAAHVERAFAQCGANVSMAARWLGITRQRLVRKLQASRSSRRAGTDRSE